MEQADFLARKVGDEIEVQITSSGNDWAQKEREKERCGKCREKAPEDKRDDKAYRLNSFLLNIQK